MARTWLSIRVELVSGRGEDYWPRPGRVLAAARSHTFEQLGAAIDLAFARWDLAHLRLFTLAEQTPVCSFRTWEDMPDGAVDSDRTTLSRLTPGDQFAYVFDMGDDWTHLCTVADHRIDPLDELGLVAAQPTPYQGWGDLPDQYGRRWDGDSGSAAPRRPSNPLADLPPILPWWGPRQP
ncbi:IS1096 element passenger TnpR family protein [Micromonospora haikouensis]|uniref:IS1096 element passenger TnpR family protein n=1 Tax=Micromonospora haikouensis TaxID=686309 RepID=UPI00378D6B9A